MRPNPVESVDEPEDEAASGRRTPAERRAESAGARNASGQAATGGKASDDSTPPTTREDESRPEAGRRSGAVAAEHPPFVGELTAVLHEEAVLAYELGRLDRDHARLDRLEPLIPLRRRRRPPPAPPRRPRPRRPGPLASRGPRGWTRHPRPLGPAGSRRPRGLLGVGSRSSSSSSDPDVVVFALFRALCHLFLRVPVLDPAADSSVRSPLASGMSLSGRVSLGEGH